MTQPDETPPPPALRVAIVAADPVRRLGLRALVAEAGHRPVQPGEDSDVVLADGGGAAAGGGRPVVTLGAGEAGQAGLLPPDAAPAQIDAALRAAAAGLTVRLPASPRPGFRALGDDAAVLLTPREAEILALIGDGLSNKAVARRLGISGHTVKFHVEALFRKLGAASRAEAVRKGLRQGLIEI